jgi:hypothetical protein
VLPAVVKAEVKLTTIGRVGLDARELRALDVPGGGLGLVAVLFAGGDPDDDARWVLLDAAAWHGRRGESVSAAQSVLAAVARGQRHLDPLRRHVDAAWPRFLVAFREAAEQGHAALVAALAAAHDAGETEGLLPQDPVLGYERREAVRALVERHGESDAGRLAQDLLAYVLALAGWRKVTLNPVGVPDFVLEQPRPTAGVAARVAASDVTLTLRRGEAERVLALCRAAGEEDLAGALEERLLAAS